MIELRKSDYGKILTLVKNTKYNKALIHSIIEGSLDADVLVDNSQNPSFALLLWEFSFLLGSVKSSDLSAGIFDCIFDTLIPSAKEKELILFLNTKNWPHLCNVLKEKGCITISRKMFSFNKEKFLKLKSCLPELPDGLKLSPAGYDNPNNFGYWIKDGSQIISKCVSIAVGANEAEIDIWTNENHRNKGYATRTAVSFIDRCMKDGIEPTWSCWPYRMESVNLAKKLGFEEAEELPVIYWAENM